MPIPAAARERSFRHLWIGALVVASLLSLQLMIEPAIGVSLTALVLIISGVVALIIAWPELERDVVQFGILGAIVGGAAEAIAFSNAGTFNAAALWRGAIFGLILGVLIGDEVQSSRKWFKLTKQTRESLRWWQRLPLQSRWLPRAVWAICGLSIVAAMSLVVSSELGWLPRGEQSQLVSDLFGAFRAAREDSSVSRDLAYVWFAVIPLCMSIALARFAARVPDNALLVDGLLRRVAVMQCAALLMLAGSIASDWITILWTSSADRMQTYYEMFAEHLVHFLRISLIPLMLLMVAQLCLGRRIVRYYAGSGWLMALGIFAMTCVFMLSFLLVYAFGIA